MSQLSVASYQFKGPGARGEERLFFELVTDNWRLAPAAAAFAAVIFSASLASPQTSGSGFHHVHLNSTDPAAAIAWYIKTFPVTSRATVAGFDGIATEKIHLLFTRTNNADERPGFANLALRLGQPGHACGLCDASSQRREVRNPTQQAAARDRVCLHERARWGIGRDQFGAEPGVRSRALVQRASALRGRLVRHHTWAPPAGQPRVRVHARRRTAPRASRWPSSARQRRPCVLTTSAS